MREGRGTIRLREASGPERVLIVHICMRALEIIYSSNSHYCHSSTSTTCFSSALTLHSELHFKNEERKKRFEKSSSNWLADTINVREIKQV